MWRGKLAEMDVVFRLLSSDDESDAATTLGSPVQAAQTLEWSPRAERREESALAVQAPLAPSQQHEGSQASAGAEEDARAALREPQVACELRPSEWTQRRGTAVQHKNIPRRPKRLEELFQEKPALSTQEVSTEKDASTEDASPLTPSEPSEILLSPASQLHVLSQISEMAESRAALARQEKIAAAGNRAAPSAPPPRHVWDSAPERTPFLPLSLPQLSSAAKRKPIAPKPRAQKKQRSRNNGVRAGLLADVATWEAFEEPILAGEDGDDGTWSFEELSDSDF